MLFQQLVVDNNRSDGTDLRYKLNYLLRLLPRVVNVGGKGEVRRELRENCY